MIANCNGSIFDNKTFLPSSSTTPLTFFRLLDIRAPLNCGKSGNSALHSDKSKESIKILKLNCEKAAMMVKLR